MAEPNVAASTVAVSGGGAAVLIGTVLGASYEVIFWSVMGALAGQRFTPPSESSLKLAWSVATAALIGVFISPIASVWAVDVLPSLGARFAGDTLRPWVAAIVAAFGPAMIPKAIDALSAFWNRLAGVSK